MSTNVAKLWAEKLFADSKGNPISAMLDREKTKAVTQWCKQAVEAIRCAPEPNPWKNATDEEIAGEIIKKIEERRRRAGISPMCAG